jgi:predicted nucleic acid-binding protein
LNTNVFSFLGKSGDKRGKIYRPQVQGKIVAVSFVTVGELYFGATKNKWSKAQLEGLNNRLRSTVIIPYDLAVCETYARLKASLPKGRVIDGNDLWIAACAVRHSIPLLTHNRKHFDDFKELIVISEEKVIHEIESQTSLPNGEPPTEPSPPSSQSGGAS